MKTKKPKITEEQLKEILKTNMSLGPLEKAKPIKPERKEDLILFQRSVEQCYPVYEVDRMMALTQKQEGEALMTYGERVFDEYFERLQDRKASDQHLSLYRRGRRETAPVALFNKSFNTLMKGWMGLLPPNPVKKAAKQQEAVPA